MGAGANYHYRSEADYLKLMEYARDMDRNDMIVGSMIDRSVANEVQNGFTCKYRTGDSRLDLDLSQRWEEERDDPEAIDIDGNLTFFDFEKLTSRAEKVDGGIFQSLPDPGMLEAIEGHRCRSPGRTSKRIIHGIELAEKTNRVVRYWFTRSEVDSFAARSTIRLKDLISQDKEDEDGFCRVLHCLNRKRTSQTRGVTALAPIFDLVGMHDDTEFAALLQRQIVSCFVAFRMRDIGFQFGDDDEAKELDTTANRRYLEDMRPGTIYDCKPGERLEGFSPNVPSPEFFPHVKLILTMMGVNLGVPLILALMDGSETNFSGWRGAYDQAKIGFRDNQRRRIVQFHRPYMRHKIRSWSEEDIPLANRIRKAAGRPNGKVDPYRHFWCPPAWPYVDPENDAQSDLIREANGQNSPRRRTLERHSMDWEDLAQEIVDDRGLMIEKAIKKANELNDRYQLEGEERIHWERLAPLATSQGVQLSLNNLGSQGKNNGTESVSSK